MRAGVSENCTGGPCRISLPSTGCSTSITSSQASASASVEQNAENVPGKTAAQPTPASVRIDSHSPAALILTAAPIASISAPSLDFRESESLKRPSASNSAKPSAGASTSHSDCNGAARKIHPSLASYRR